MAMSYLEFFEWTSITQLCTLERHFLSFPMWTGMLTTGIYQLILLTWSLCTQSKIVYALLIATAIFLSNHLFFCHLDPIYHYCQMATRQELTLYVLSLVSLEPNVHRLLLSVSLLLIFPFQSAGHFSAWTESKRNEYCIHLLYWLSV